MRLLITTPSTVVIDRGDIVALRAEDDTGGFGILPGHTDFLTALAISVVGWRQRDGGRGYCAVRRGVLTVTGGKEIAIATRQAVVGDDLDRLESDVLTEFRSAGEAERSARTESMQLHMRAIREIIRYLRPTRPATFGGPQ